jgi:hypothetical protein
MTQSSQELSLHEAGAIQASVGWSWTKLAGVEDLAILAALPGHAPPQANVALLASPMCIWMVLAQAGFRFWQHRSSAGLHNLKTALRPWSSLMST